MLKHEAFTDSALARFVLRRALAAPATVGHTLFWYLRAEMDTGQAKHRCGVLVDLFLRRCSVA